MAVRDSAEGVRGDDADRERASDAVRSVSRSFLLSAALGGVVIPMIGVPLGAVAMIGAFQRMQALSALHATMIGAKLVPTEWSRRTRLAAMTELGVGGLGVVFSLVGVPAVVMIATEGLWLGAGGLSAVAGSMAMRAAWARAAATGEVVDPGRGIVPMMAGIGAITLGVAVSSLGGALPGAGGVAALLMIAGVLGWAVGAVMLAFAGSALAGEVSLPSKRASSTPDERHGSGRARAPVPQATVRAPMPPPDDDPIPY
jgi:hypothetical protein